MKTAIFDPRAEDDIADAFQYLESRQVGLGTDFLSELLDTIAKIEQNPYLFQIEEEPVRRGKMKRFSYKIYDQVWEENQVLILSVHHTSQQGGSWKRRV